MIGNLYKILLQKFSGIIHGDFRGSSSSSLSGAILLNAELAHDQRQTVLQVQRSLQNSRSSEEGDDVEGEVGGAEKESSNAEPTPFTLTGTSFLFTWNIGAPEDPHAEWLHFLEWRSQQSVGAFRGVRFSATMEESLQSEDVDRVHIHEQREMCKKLTRAAVDTFQYTTVSDCLVKPNCAANYMEAIGSSSDGQSRGRGAAYRAACDRAHFYVQANKFGTLFVETNWPMQTNFRVQAKWFDDLVARGKLSRDQWLQYAYDTTIGFSSRRRNFEALETYEKDKAITADVAELQRQIAERCPKKPWRADLVQEVQGWLEQFAVPNDRATILVLWGPSRSGKTRFAMSDVFGSKPLKVDVGDGQDLNIQGWDHRTHSHLVLDNVNGSDFIMRWRHVLMGPPEAVQLGQSQTGMYTYSVFLGRKPVVCSMDEDATWTSKRWLDANCKVLWVSDKCYIE